MLVAACTRGNAYLTPRRDADDIARLDLLLLYFGGRKQPVTPDDG